MDCQVVSCAHEPRPPGTAQSTAKAGTCFVAVTHIMLHVVCPQLVYSSTCAVYGNQEQLPITEASQPLPINPYGAYGHGRAHALRTLTRGLHCAA
jgi:UDP-glucose 4-epimerase